MKMKMKAKTSSPQKLYIVTVLNSVPYHPHPKKAYQYLPEHVIWLASAVAKHMSATTPYEFLCFSDQIIDDLSVTTVSLQLTGPGGYLGWWSKLEMFRPTCNPLTDPANANAVVLYIDLDTVITGSLQHLIDLLSAPALTPGLWMLKSMSKHPNRVGSGVMGWKATPRMTTALVPLYQRFASDPQTYMVCYTDHAAGRWGDQDFIANNLDTDHTNLRLFQDHLPEDTIVSFKYDLGQRLPLNPPSNTAIVAMHGLPKPWDLNL